MKVIFLDIDGVLNLIPQGHDEYGAIFHQHFMDNLKRIIDKTDAKIVISSTWRMAGLEEMQKMWKVRGIAGEVIDVTPHGCTKMSYYHREYIPEEETTPRGLEIKYWLENAYKNKIFDSIENYVILDDDTDMLLNQKDNFVQCSGNIEDEDCVDVGYGLTNKCTDKAIKILNG